MEQATTISARIGELAGGQAQRRIAAEEALGKVVEEAASIAALAETVAARSRNLSDDAEVSSNRARETVEGAGRVVSVTESLENLSSELSTLVAQFNTGNGVGRGR